MPIHLPQDAAITLLGKYAKDTSSYHTETYPTKFIAALFIVAKNWKQQLPLNRILDKENVHLDIWCVTQSLKNDIMKFASKWMELEKNHRERGIPHS